MPKEEHEVEVASGLGVLCAEAQADGVPCPGPQCRCETCERARTKADHEPAPPTGNARA